MYKQMISINNCCGNVYRFTSFKSTYFLVSNLKSTVKLGGNSKETYKMATLSKIHTHVYFRSMDE